MRGLCFSCVVCGLWSLLVLAPPAAAEVLAGVARVEFALPSGVPLAGYSRRKGASSRGMHDPVGVRALVFEDGATTAALVSCDLLMVDERLADAVHRRLIAEGLPPALILMLAGTHTHSGPGAYGARFFEKISMGHYDPRVFEALVDAITGAVVAARDTRSPVRIAWGTTQTRGLAANRVDPHGLIEEDVTVVGFFRQTGNDPLAVLVNFSAHPTVLGAWNLELSADYPGAIVRALEQRYPKTVALFFAGSVADQAPVKSGDGFARVEEMGRELAQAAAAILDGAHPQPLGVLRARQERMPLPPARVRLGRLSLPRWLGSQFVDDDATLSVVEAGSTVFFGVPCDLAASLGLRLKRAARAQELQPMVIGFASDYIGYCVPESLYDAKQYESSMAFNGPKAGELVVERLVHIMNQLRPGDIRHETSDTRQELGARR